MRGLSSIWIPLFLFPRDSDWRVPFKVTLNPVTLVGVGSTDMNGMPLSLTLPESKENAVYTEIKHVSLNSKAYAAILHQSSSGNQNIKQKKDFTQCTLPNPCISLKCIANVWMQYKISQVTFYGGFYSQSSKTVNIWNISGMFIVSLP